jgi:hypothetical protein
MDFSALKTEWHPTKNLPLVFSSSLSKNEKYWWMGECGHEWEATLTKRTGKNSGCLVCSSFALIYPDLASEWHPTKNGDLSPTQLSAKDSGKYWWMGECGHEWEATMHKRKGKNNGCLVCSSFALVYPDLASEWHPTKNGDLSPTQLSKKDSGKYWWVGECGHEWEDYIHERTNGKACRICSGHQFVAGVNDFATVNPVLVSEWHPTKNDDLTPEKVLFKSSTKAWWLCSENHEWEAPIKSRSIEDLGCPYCTNRRLLIGFNDFATVNPDLVSEWHPTKNDDLTPEQFIAVSSTKAWWLGDCGHEWETSFSSRSKGSRCPYCSNRKVLTGFNDLTTMNPSLASEWHPTKNGNLNPEDVSAGSGIRVWWFCDKDHEWQALVINRNANGSKCPICEYPEYYKKELLVGTNDLACVELEIASQWHPTKNGELTPDAIVRMSDEKVWWLAECGYEWEATPKSRKNNGCPECIRLKIRRGANDLSSVSPVVASEWHPTKNSDLLLQHISAGSEKKVWWQCIQGHEWQAMVKNRVSKKMGCPECAGRRKPKVRTFAGRNVVLGVNDLPTTNPVIAAEWHSTKNGDLIPEHVSTTSHKKVWWLCSENHEWECEVRHRVKGRKCPLCA